MPTDTANWTGAVLSGKRYQVSAKLGEGGMGIVYRARDLHLSCDVVIKVPRLAMLQDADFAGRFEREVRSLVRLVHPHIVKVTDVGKHQEIPFAVMQYLPGGSLRDRLQVNAQGKGTPRPLAELGDWLREVAAALDYIHGQRYIHRDVKPDNILFDAHGCAYLSDFGIAKVMADTPQRDQRTVMTNAGMVLGTAPYMAPEMLLGQPYDGRADQFALGVTVYQMLTGVLPFDGTTPGAILMALNNPPQPVHQRLASLPKALSAVVQKALHRDPAQRYAGCSAFAETVMALVQAKPLVGQAVTMKPAQRPKPAESANCPLCEKSFNLDPALRGRRVRCPNCSGIFIPRKKRDESAQVETGNVSGSLTMPVHAQNKRSFPPDWAVKHRTALYMGGGGVLGVVLIVLLIAALGGFRSGERKAKDPVANTDVSDIDKKDNSDPKKETAGDGPKKDGPKKDANTTVPKDGAPPKPNGDNPVIAVGARQHVHAMFGKYFTIGFNAGDKKLTSFENGGTNSTLIKVDNFLPFEFGDQTLTFAKPISHTKKTPDPRWEAITNDWTRGEYDINKKGNLEVTQIVELIPSKQPHKDQAGVVCRLLDTILVRYTLCNKDTQARRVGLRAVIDTDIASNDGAPFAVPTLPHLVKTSLTRATTQVPLFIQAMQRPNLQDPGVVAQMTFRVGNGVAPPDRVMITRFAPPAPVKGSTLRPFADLRWEIPEEPFKTDSCVVMYWDPVLLQSEETRTIGYAYGLGHLEVSPQGKLATTLGGVSFGPGDEFMVLAYVEDPREKQTLTLELGNGLKLVEGEKKQPVPLLPDGQVAGHSIVTWKVKGERFGRFQLSVSSNTGERVTHPVTIFRPRPPE